jgi:DHA1 family tetracycline resistance protein-like MFS transporter
VSLIKKKSHLYTLFTVFFTFFLDSLGASLVFPLFAPLFLAKDSAFLSEGSSYFIKSICLGAFLASYPLSQLICAPFVGVFADKKGIKKGLILTSLFSFIGYLICGFSIELKGLFFLFLARVIMGASSSNSSVCFTALSLYSDSEEKKIKYISLASLIAGACFVLGPIIGGKLSDPTLHPLVSLSTPFWFGAIVAFLNLVLLIFLFQEKQELEKAAPHSKIEAIKNIKEAFEQRSIKKYYTLFFVYLLFFNMLFQFIPAFLVGKFSLSSSLIGDVCATLGAAWVLGSVIFSLLFSEKRNKKIILGVSGAVFSLFAFLSSFCASLFWFVFFLACSVFFSSFIWPICTSIISASATKEIQGKIFGFTQSVQSLSMLIAPLIISPFLTKDAAISIYIASGVGALFTSLCFLLNFEKNKK